jgi:hypothetical protein
MLGSTGLMGEDSRRRGRASGLTDRRAECGVLDRLISTVRAGGSRVLVVHGEPGVGKSALLEYLAGRAAGCRVVRTAGVESEMELAFAGLHQLLAPVLDRVEGLPGPQREALGTVRPWATWSVTAYPQFSIVEMLVQKSAVGPLPLPRGRVGVQGPADDQPCGGDLLDAEQVTVGQRAAWLPGMDRMVVAGAEDQVPCAGLGAVGDAHRVPGRDDAEADHDRSRSGPAVRPDHDLAPRSSLRPRRGPDRRYGHAARPGRLHVWRRRLPAG